MKRKFVGYSSLLLSLIGLCCFLSLHHKTPTSKNNPAPSSNEEMIAPAIVDSLTDILHLPTLQNGVITKIHVAVGQRVEKGQTLISLDDTKAKHNVIVNQIALYQANNNFMAQKNNLNRVRAHLKRLKNLDRRVISQSELQDKTHEVNMAKIQLKQAQYNLDTSKENLAHAQLILSQFRIKAPKDGVVLKIDARTNEFVRETNQVILLGDATKVLARISIDERDIMSFTPNDPVYLTSNENEQLKIPLTFLQLDQYIINQERLHSRVLEALYFFNRDEHPNVMAGQQLDAHIVLKSKTMIQ